MAKVLIVGNDVLQAADQGRQLHAHERVYSTIESALYNFRENPNVELVILADDSPRTLSAYDTLRDEEYEGPFLVLAQQRIVPFPKPNDISNIFTLTPQESPFLAEVVDDILAINERLRLQYPATQPDSSIQEPAH